MPGTPTPNLGLPTLDAAADYLNDYPVVYNSLVSLLDAIVAVGFVPIGGELAYEGTTDPPGGIFLLADGRLIDTASHGDYFTAVGHAYNGSVDPGGGMVRIADKRGRAHVGADNMGTARGAAGRLVGNRARGQNGGEEKHTLTLDEIGAESINVQAFTSIATDRLHAKGFTSHNNMQPYEVGNVIVRVR